MAKYIVVHPLGKELTLDAVKPAAASIRATLTSDAYWIKTCYLREEGKAYCEWDAKDAESIRKVLAEAAPDMPTEGIYEIDMMVNSEDFR